MTPVSLMPPVDYCPSCEGRKDEAKAIQIGEARARQEELRSADGAFSAAGSEATPAPGALPAEGPSQATTGDAAKPVATVVQTLLAPDLAVQAALARPAIDAASTEAGAGQNEALRLRAAQAYGTN